MTHISARRTTSFRVRLFRFELSGRTVSLNPFYVETASPDKAKTIAQRVLSARGLVLRSISFSPGEDGLELVAYIQEEKRT